jgi:hypothetical protein
MTELEKYIQSYFGISQEDLVQVGALFKRQTIKKGDFFLQTGRVCDKLSFIHSGLLRIYVQTPDKEVPIHCLHARHDSRNIQPHQKKKHFVIS